METSEIIESANRRYDELGTKPNWGDWYRGYIAGAIWAYDKLSPPSCDAATKDIAAVNRSALAEARSWTVSEAEKERFIERQ